MSIATIPDAPDLQTRSRTHADPDQRESAIRLAMILKQLADPTRLEILMELCRNGESNVSTLCRMTGQSQPLVSHHLSLLRLAQLVRVRKSGKHHFYSIRSEQFQVLVDQLFRRILAVDETTGSKPC